MLAMVILPDNLKGVLSKAVIETIKKYIDTKEYKIFYFGSRVTGKCHDRSDIDIGILGLDPIQPQVIQRIEDQLRESLPTLLKIELVDFHNVSDDFKKVSLSEIESINQND